jgi:arabinogalactan oligomer/maltooligosaccharide transport system permease protein
LFWPLTLAGGAFVGWFAAPDDFGVMLQYVAIAAGAVAMVAAVFKYIIRGAHRVALMMLAPAFLVMCAVVIYPFLFQVRLSFADLDLHTIRNWIETGNLSWVGFKNFVDVFREEPIPLVTFWMLLFRTVLWTIINVSAHVFFGVCLALILHRGVKWRGLYRTLLIIPWAMPQVIVVLALRGEFHPQFGVVNQILQMFYLPSINWWSDPIPVFISCCLVNIWLGIPFMMIVFLGGLQSISNSYYEAASIDGASKWQQFWGITVPLLRPVTVPAITLGTIWTFNNINVIYLMTAQGGGTTFADILVSALYKSAFTYYRYSYSAAFAVIIFGILIAFTTLWILLSRGTENTAA